MLWLLGCSPLVEVDLWEGPNHLLPLYVAAEPGRIWSFSRMLGTVAVVEQGEWVRSFALEDFPPAPARIVATPEGLWVLWADHAALHAPSGERLRVVDEAVYDVSGDTLAVDGALLVGGERVALDGLPLRVWEDAVLLDDGRLQDREGQTLCQLPFASRLADWDGQRVAVTKGEELATCQGRVTLREPKQPLFVDGELWVLDRLGPEPTPWLSEARVLDPDTLEELRQVPTGRNSGYGGWDGQELWVNSEGSSELLGLLGGERVTLGAHVESVSGELVSGRLSNRVWRGDLSAELDWPVAPLEQGRRSFVLLQNAGELVELDAQLREVGRRSVGAVDGSLTLGDTALWRGEVFVSRGGADELVLPDGERIPLGEPLHRDASGRLELVATEDALFVIRCRDGRVQRFDGELSEPVWVELSERTRMQLGGWDEERGLLWVGPWGLDPDTLQVVDEADWELFVGRWRGEPVSWSEGALWLGDERLREQPGEELPELTLDGGRVIVTDIGGAAVHTVSL